MSNETHHAPAIDASMRAHYEATAFLNREAEVLDDGNQSDWLELVTEDVTYLVPVRVTREVGDDVPEYSREAFHYRENYETLTARTTRFDKDYAWSENPRTRTRRFVSNVRVADGDADGDELSVKSNFMLYHARGEQIQPNFISGERLDTLRRVDGELRLAERVVHLDQTVMGTKNLSVLL